MAVLYNIMRSDGTIFQSLRKGKYAGWNGKRRRRRIFGTLSCGTGKRMKKENRVFFHSYDDAIAAGFRPCKNCKPVPDSG